MPEEQFTVPEEKKAGTEPATSTFYNSTPPASPARQARRSIPLKWIILAALIIVVLALLYMFRSVFVAATIGGKPISRLTVVRELEKQMGAQVLDSLVTQTLIEQKAAAGNFTVSADDIQKEIAAIEENLSKQGTTLDEALTTQNITRVNLERDIRLRKLAEKLVADKVTISDEEIATYIEENKQFMPPAESDDALKEQVRTMISQQKFSTAFQEWLTAAKAEANISYWKEY